MSNLDLNCDECKKDFKLASKDVTTRKFSIKGEVITYTFFTCPHCGKVYPVQLDNIGTLELYKTVRNVMLFFKNNLVNPTKAQIKQVDKQQARLKTKRAKLVKKYNGSVYQFNDNIYKLEFNVPAILNAGEKETK